MSLAEAVLEVADAMDEVGKESKKAGNSGAAVVLMSFARELRTAVKASAGTEAKPSASLAPEFQHLVEIEKARKQVREERMKGVGADASEPRMVEAVGGGLDGTMVAVDSGMPVGAKVAPAGQVYVLDSVGRLWYSEEETAKIAGQLAEQAGVKKIVVG